MVMVSRATYPVIAPSLSRWFELSVTPAALRFAACTPCSVAICFTCSVSFSHFAAASSAVSLVPTTTMVIVEKSGTAMTSPKPFTTIVCTSFSSSLLTMTVGCSGFAVGPGVISLSALHPANAATLASARTSENIFFHPSRLCFVDPLKAIPPSSFRPVYSDLSL
ncbi:hypothetical protein SDC9_175652 [bioreactor metagenome]|uniref:Uncharacterized protein n=1 Tax=bioreactor metagenome TaxID=1076179 RepID=A0A645GMN9_9ZZZZ